MTSLTARFLFHFVREKKKHVHSASLPMLAHLLIVKIKVGENEIMGIAFILLKSFFIIDSSCFISIQIRQCCVQVNIGHLFIVFMWSCGSAHSSMPLCHLCNLPIVEIAIRSTGESRSQPTSGIYQCYNINKRSALFVYSC